MSAAFKFSYISSLYFTFCLLVAVALFRLCLSTKKYDDATLCLDDERQALLQFKHGLIDETGRLASWVGETSDCCKWAGVHCDNITGHFHKIHLPGNFHFDGYYKTIKEYEEAKMQRLSGDISPSILYLKQLEHLDLSGNDFRGIRIPKFIGSLGNLRYLNLSGSRFGGPIPPQLGNLTELGILCLGSFYYDDTDEYESTTITNMQWLSSLRLLHHLDMSGVDLTKATDWFQGYERILELMKDQEVELRDLKETCANLKGMLAERQKLEETHAKEIEELQAKAEEEKKKVVEDAQDSAVNAVYESMYEMAKEAAEKGFTLPHWDVQGWGEVIGKKAKVKAADSQETQVAPDAGGAGGGADGEGIKVTGDDSINAQA